LTAFQSVVHWSGVTKIGKGRKTWQENILHIQVW
jgi:hypothetical protein